MNYMKHVAQMLGVEIGEEFKVDGENNRFKFTENELEYFDEGYNAWVYDCSYINDILVGILTGNNEIIKQPILDDVEKEYLSAVIRPFREKVQGIEKKLYRTNLEYLSIAYLEGDLFQRVAFPIFKKDTMYKGMELHKEYSLEELGV